MTAPPRLAPARGAGATARHRTGSAGTAALAAAIRRGGAYGGIEGGYDDNVGTRGRGGRSPADATVRHHGRPAGVRDVYLVFQKNRARPNRKTALPHAQLHQSSSSDGVGSES